MGEVEIVRSLHDSTTHLSTIGDGGILGEAIFLDDSAHTVGAVARRETVVLQIARAEIDALRDTKQDAYCRLVARIARRMHDRLQHLSERLAGQADADRILTSARREHDLLGERELPGDV